MKIETFSNIFATVAASVSMVMATCLLAGGLAFHAGWIPALLGTLLLAMSAVQLHLVISTIRGGNGRVRIGFLD